MHLVRRHAPILNQPQPITPQAIPRRQAAPIQAQHHIQAMIPLPSSRPSQAVTQYQGKPSQAKRRPAKIAASLPAFSPPAPSPKGRTPQDRPMPVSMQPVTRRTGQDRAPQQRRGVAVQRIAEQKPVAPAHSFGQGLGYRPGLPWCRDTLPLTCLCLDLCIP